MKFSCQVYRWLSLVGVCALGCCWFGSSARAGEQFGLESVGGRMGWPLTSNAPGFKQAEAFANLELPWRWDLGKGWRLEPRLDASTGWLTDTHADAFVGTLGPALVLGWRQFPVTVEAGVSPTILSRYDFPSRDLGLPFQFTTHAGVNWEFLPHFCVSYRFQHMSNAGLGDHNPGLNLHCFGLSYVF